jgi:alpha-ketoglutarate-dependent taurine dioxygenase
MSIVNENLAVTGALLFRGFHVGGVEGFESFTRWFREELMTYDHGSTPRSQISGKVYTSTEYPSHQTIPLHNEMAYTTRWPLKLWFYSHTVAEEGGETPIADSREVFRRIRPEIRAKFNAHGLMYTRNYKAGMDVPWQKVFNTEDRERVAEICHANQIEFEWISGNELRTRQICQASAIHPATGEDVWFNQAHLFHVSNLEERVRKAMLSIYKQEELPRNVFYGNGEPIQDQVLAEIRAVIEEVKVVFSWHKDDILMVDNMAVAHGRNPFKGQRKVAVAMAGPYSLN